MVALRFAGLDFSKCYWAIWGGDLYCYTQRPGQLRTRFRNWVRKSLVRRLGHVLTFISGDVVWARKWYGFRGAHHECLMYLSNTVQPQNGGSPRRQVDPTGWNVMVGNSGYDTNHHFEIFDRLLDQAGEGLGKVYCPLSYGNQSYIQEVVARGTVCFGDKFVPLLDFLPMAQYMRILDNVDAAIYGHRRQQAMGNSIALLGMGKKVFLRPDVPQWNTFTDLGIKVYDFMDLTNPYCELGVQAENLRIAREYFSEKNLARQYENIFSAG